MPRDLAYPREQGNTLHRLSQRARYDLHTIHSIINSTLVLHVSFNAVDPAQGPFPAILPMIGQMGSFSRPSADLEDTLDCYLHGYVTSRLMKLARENPAEGLPVTIAATKCDGLVLSLTPFSHSYNYRSAVLFGYASPVDDAEEKLWAMQLITDSVVPERWNHTRTPPKAEELSSTTILRVTIASGSAKIRDGEPHDDKKDLDRSDITDTVWTGVVPMWETLGEPVASGSNRVDGTPEHIQSFVDRINQSKESYARSVTRDA
ncbi:MAG: hypothetical protein L6R40_002451 [Gallowayella cf. fulva]|nr:MAG: hypothetical protein L6R40_002451 [Xanthomendoza cf. fulva]